MTDKFWNPEIETKPIEELKKLQLERLKNLIRYVYNNNRYYHDRLKEVNVRPNDIKNLKEIDVAKIGRLIRFHKRFSPEGTNVDFVRILNKKTLEIRTYERGIEEETLACGTGAVASAIIAGLKKIVSSPVEVMTRGGEKLKVCFDKKAKEGWKEGCFSAC